MIINRADLTRMNIGQAYKHSSDQETGARHFTSGVPVLLVYHEGMFPALFGPD